MNKKSTNTKLPSRANAKLGFGFLIGMIIMAANLLILGMALK